MPRASLRTFFIFIAVVAVASSQTLAPKPLPKEPLEKYDNPPPLAPAVATSPGLISQFGPYTSYQVNVNANGDNIVGDAANEPSICVDPTNRNKMSIGWRQFDSVSSNFRQAGFAHTTNGGRTWIPVSILERRRQLWRPTIHSINQWRTHLDESYRYSQFPCIRHTGRRFQRESLHRRGGTGGWPGLVCSLHQCKERRRS